MVNLKDELTLDASLLHGVKQFSTSNDNFYHNQAGSYQQPICPYICSTFIDLEEEFKYLHAHTFSQLNELCRQRHSFFLPFDFRRTAIENRSSADSILKHSLDNVLSSLPYFLCIIGSQYGKHRSPSSGLLSAAKPGLLSTPTPHPLSILDQNLLTASNDYPWVIEENFHACSMMELEITLACFLSETHLPKYCYFYIKETFLCQEQSNIDSFLEGESEYAQNRLYDLKLKIVNKGLPVKFFTSSEDLGEKIFKDWSEIIVSRLSNPGPYQVHGN